MGTRLASSRIVLWYLLVMSNGSYRPAGHYQQVPYMSSNSRESYSSSAKLLPNDLLKAEYGFCEYVRLCLLMY